MQVTNSKSTDKLILVCDVLEKRILAESELKSRVKKIEIIWKTLVDKDDGLFVPDLKIEFKD